MFCDFSGSFQIPDLILAMSDPHLARDGGAGEKGGGGLSLPGGDLFRPPVPSTGGRRDTPTPGPGPTSTPSSSTSASAPLPAASAATLPQGRGGQAKGTSQKCVKKSFQEIIEESKTNRNILEICVQRPPRLNPEVVDGANAASTNNQPETLTYDDFADFLFDELSVKPEDCLTFNYSFSNFSNKEVGFKPPVDISRYLGNFSFRGHTIITRRQSSKTVRVTFKNVPLCVPDQELVNIIECYGEVTDSVVHYQAASNPKARGIVNMNTRYIEMVLGEKKMPNYFWLEGPLPSDVGGRVTVTYPGQTPQCYNCLRIGNLCPAEGKGKLCVQQRTERLRMDLYINTLHLRDSFSTLKSQHAATCPLPGQVTRRVVVEEQDIDMHAEEEKDRLIDELRFRLGREEQLRLEQEERCRTAEQVVRQVKQQQQEKRQEMEQEINKMRQVHEKCIKEQEAVSQDQESRMQEEQEQEQEQEEQESRVEEEQYRAQQKSKMQEFETQIADMLPTSESFEEVTSDLADSSFLPDFHLKVKGGGEETVTTPEYFLEIVKNLVDESNRERFIAIREAIVKKIAVRKKFESEIVREKSAIIRKSRSVSKRKSEGEHVESSNCVRSRLDATSLTPPFEELPTLPTPGTPPTQHLLPPRPPTPGLKVKQQVDEVAGATDPLTTTTV